TATGSSKARRRTRPPRCRSSPGARRRPYRSAAIGWKNRRTLPQGVTASACDCAAAATRDRRSALNAQAKLACVFEERPTIARPGLLIDLRQGAAPRRDALHGGGASDL